jgi:hypothetical protein
MLLEVHDSPEPICPLQPILDYVKAADICVNRLLLPQRGVNGLKDYVDNFTPLADGEALFG